MEDQRFCHVMTDPKFRRIPKKEQKIKIDKRFQSMFEDNKFKVTYTTDKRGRPVSNTSTEDLKRYYELSSEDESSESDREPTKIKESSKIKKKSNDLNLKHTSDKAVSSEIKKKLKNLNVDYARGEAVLYSESSSDDEDSEAEVSENEEIEHKWGELDVDAEQTEEATYRLAACNMNWDRIRAVDLMVLFNSFLPSGGVIKSVVIYLSEFGKARIQEEEMRGPIELVELKKTANEDDAEEGSGYHMEKLRQYQLNRLKYYYAVITFDSVYSANKIYTECDGMEYESSAIKLDLRFIPDDMEFNEEPKEICYKLPEVNKYEPRFFTTTALQQAKVDLTWDETNPDRIEIAQKLNSGKVDDITDADLQNYLASSSDEEGIKSKTGDSATDEENSESGTNIVDKYKALLQDIEEKEKSKNEKVEMEISWGIKLKEKTEQLAKQKLDKFDEKTPFQQYIEKRKNKMKEKKKEKLKARQKNSESSQSDSDIPSDIDMSDPYFAEEFRNSDFKKPKNRKLKIENNDNEDEQNKAEIELLLMNEVDSKRHFNLKNIQVNENTSNSKKKRKHKNIVTENLEDNFEVNTKDERFSALFTSHHFNIDPTDPHYKKTKAMETLVNEKIKRRLENTDNTKPINKKQKPTSELSLLVKSVKRKAHAFKNRK